MKKSIALLCCSLLLFLFLAQCSFAPCPAFAAEKIRAIKVFDGDSMLVEHQGQRIELRLMGIDAPEIKQTWGSEAKNFTARWVESSPLQLSFGTRRIDCYGRLLAYVWKGEQLLNEDIVKNGLALPYMLNKNDPLHSRIHKALHEAKAKKTGFWKNGGLDLYPWQWRKAHPKKKNL